ncbi:MAG: putative integrase [Halomonadaceae bacterium T82-2]|nr:MAG: putative integrase [Halomonadaceae bacterium T82-2]
MKRSQIKRRPLADTVLATLEPEDKAYRVADGGGLYFRVKPNGSKSWELRYKAPDTSKWTWYGLGSYTELSGSKARKKALEAQDLLREGIDPAKQRRAQKAAEDAARANTFRRAAEYWYEHKEKNGRRAATLKGMRLALDRDILPAIGDRPIGTLEHPDCVAIQEAIEARGAHNTAEKVRGWLREIFGMAVAKGWCFSNPASEMHRVAAQAPKEKQLPHLYESELPAFLRALRQTPSRTLVATAAWMTVLTASRPGMVRQAEWSEIDLDNALWSIPGEKMKMHLPHLAPLPTQVVELLRELKRTTGRSKWVFPSNGPKNPVLSDNSINKCFALIGYKGKMTGHGSRHTFKTLVSEHGWKTEWSERHLAHVKKGEEATYDKAQYLAPRRIMIQWYADYLEALEAGMTPEIQAEFDSRVNVLGENIVELVRRA